MSETSEQQRYGRLDWWQATDRADEAEVREQARRIEQRGQAEDEVAARAAYLDLLAIRPGERVLEVGCGSGVVLRDLARRVGPDGTAVGLDYSPLFLQIARELAVGAPGRAPLLCRGDARALPFGDGRFDVVLAATALAHVPDGERAIPEMVRVARPGGRVAVFDRDIDSSIIAHPDRELTRRIVHAATDHATVNGWLARRLPGLLARAGLEDVRVRGFIPLEHDPASYYGSLLRRRADLAVQSGAISEEEAGRWLAQLDAEQAAGGFLSGLVQLFAWGTRPTAPPS